MGKALSARNRAQGGRCGRLRASRSGKSAGGDAETVRAEGALMG